MPVALPLSGVRKAAILLLLLGEEVSGAIFRHLREEEIERIAKEVAALGAVAPESSETILEEFHQMSMAASYVARGGVDYAEQLLLKSLSPENARRISISIAPTPEHAGTQRNRRFASRTSSRQRA